jgi:hypothetical protein
LYVLAFCFWANFGDRKKEKKRSNMTPTKDFLLQKKKRPKVAISQGEKTEITMFRQ